MRALCRGVTVVVLGMPVLLGGCGGNGSDSARSSAPIAVSLSTSGGELAGGSTSAITASLANDFGADGVTWSLAGVGTLTYPPSTLLSSPKLECFYNAPQLVTAKTTVTILATSARDSSKTASITLTVYPTVTLSADPPPPQAQAGTPYSYQVTGAGGKGPLIYVVSDGVLPPGLTLSRDGLLSGTPSTTGSYVFKLQAQDLNLPSIAAATTAYTVDVI